jgi:2-aminoethylphosphonate transport system permease protein
VLPSHPTLAHYVGVLGGESSAELRVSLVTGAIATLFALGFGTWAAPALRRLHPLSRRWLEFLFFLPIAVPSVAVGLGLLVAFSRPPLLLNGTPGIVVLAHTIMLSAFAYGSVSAGLADLPESYEQVAAGLGARPFYVLRRVTLPLPLPYLLAATGLSFALSMGELGATMMVYPLGWATLPVRIFALTDRGQVFDGAALTVVLILATLLVLLGLSAVRSRSVAR